MHGCINWEFIQTHFLKGVAFHTANINITYVLWSVTMPRLTTALNMPLHAISSGQHEMRKPQKRISHRIEIGWVDLGHNCQESLESPAAAFYFTALCRTRLALVTFFYSALYAYTKRTASKDNKGA